MPAASQGHIGPRCAGPRRTNEAGRQSAYRDPHEEHGATRVFRPREIDHLAQAQSWRRRLGSAKEEFRISYKVDTVSPPMGVLFFDYKTGGNAVVLSRR